MSKKYGNRDPNVKPPCTRFSLNTLQKKMLHSYYKEAEEIVIKRFFK